MNSSQDLRSYIKDLLKKRFSPDFLNVIDESDQHVGHEGHQMGGRHFYVEIASEALRGISRIEAHRLIYQLFKEQMPKPIHALRIKIID